MLSLSRVISAIVIRHVMRHKEWAEEQTIASLHATLREGTLTRFFDKEQLEAIIASDGSDISNLLRIGWRERKGNVQEDRKEGAV